MMFPCDIVIHGLNAQGDEWCCFQLSYAANFFLTVKMPCKVRNFESQELKTFAVLLQLLTTFNIPLWIQSRKKLKEKDCNE